ncbi:hypothetical protein A6U90_26610 [Agrobacterium tumefaciens]|nr:hypothetical protein A6U90_26610 [Agrobacterium tumefaciens]
MTIAGDYDFEITSGKRLLNHEEGQYYNTKSAARGGKHHLTIVCAKLRVHANLFPSVGAMKTPAYRIEGVKYGVVRSQFSGLRGAPSGFQIGWTGNDSPTDLCKFSRNQHGIRDASDPYRQVIRLGDKIRLTVFKADIEMNPWMEEGELCQQRSETELSKSHGNRDSNLTRCLSRRPYNHLLRGL